MSVDFLNTDFEKVSYLVSLLTARATNGSYSDPEYEKLRYELLSNNDIAGMLSIWVKLHRSLDSFWGFIQPKFGFSSIRGLTMLWNASYCA